MMYLRNAQGFYRPQCTVGFNARSTVDSKWYVMTAGHCGSIGQTFYMWQPRTLSYHVLGHMHNRVYPGPTGQDDFGIITVDNVLGWNPQPWVYVHAWTGPVAGTTENPSYGITGIEGSKKGMRVCTSGAISGTSCQNVERVGIEPGGLAQVDLCADHGDSGAPIYSAGKARGLMTGANVADPGQDPTPACTDRLYQGITEASQRLRVSVVHT